ncbi:tyrosine-type recombinase/integrase [Nonomuraea sp. NPDC050536]|uniref:tyrosine-type recombinase/integrase n=1 Tax=Nonomuraea sp. NPDC050536 TaxID=3364366 RepID=UPI0037C8510E
MTQGKKLDVFVSIPQRQQPRHSEGVRDGQTSQAENHKRSSCRDSVPSESRTGTPRDQSDKQDDLHGSHYRQGHSPVRLHDLRRGAASLVLAAGVEMKVVQETLGHTSSAFTADTYTSVYAHVATTAAEKTAALLFGEDRIQPGKLISLQG